MKRIVFILVTAVISANTIAQGQQPVGGKLSFDEALKIGLNNNVTYRIEQNTLESRAAQRLQGYGLYLPSVNASGFVQRTEGLQIDPTTGSAINVSSDFIQGNVTANYTIFNGFNRINTIRQNNNLFNAQNSLVKRAKQDVVFTVSSQYLQVLLDQELLRIAEENLATQKVVLDQINGFVSVGARAEADLYTQDALLKNAQVTYLRAKMTLENDRAALMQTLQLDPAVQIEVTRANLDLSPTYFNSMSLDSLYKIAETHRQDLQQQENLVDAGKFGKRASAGGYFPTLSAFVSYGSTYFASNSWRSNGDIPRPPTFSNQFWDMNPSLSYGLSLQIPIFDRFLTRTNRVIARNSFNNAILQRDNLMKGIKIDVQRSYQNYLNAIESYNAAMVQFQAGELALKTQQESYNLGIASQVELAQATQTFVQAASSRAQAEVTLFFQKVLLEYALGTLRVEE
jgi:outer membrane protein